MRLYQRALETAAALPDTPLGELFTPTPDERRRLDEWNRSAADYPRDQTLLGPLLDQAHATPSAIAAVQGEATLTYERLDRRSAAVARALARRGVTRGAIVALCVERTLALFPAVLGILRAGAAHLPLDPSWPGDRLRLMIEDAGVAALVTESHLRARLGSSAPTLCLDADAVEIDDLEDPSLPLPPAPLPTDPAYVLYTSGSTGRPKGVVVGHRALHNLLASVRTSPGLAASDVVLAVTTISFDISTYDLFLPFMTGACVVLASRAEATDGQALARLIDRHGVTLMQATPATWQLLLAAGWNGRRGMRALSTGEALPPDLARRLLALDLELWNLYGPTETTVWCTLTRVEHVDGPIPIGRPVANTRLHVVDERLRLLPPGLPGEPLIGGDGLADGYLGRPDLTAEKFIPDPFTPGARLYRTGDLARWRDDGTLECMGRIDAQVKLRGYRIELGEIEAALRADPSVGEAAVALREDTPGNPRLAGYVVAAPGAAPDLAALRDRLRRSLPDYMVPSAIVILDALPLTPSGKLDRRRLPVPDPVLRPADEDALPRTHVEMLLAAIWADLLSLPRVRRDDNFFELGGHSLLAARVAARVREAFAVDLPLADCFEAPLLADLALRIEALMAAGPGAAADALPLLPVARDGVLPLSFAQQRLWFLDQMEPENAAYLVAFGLRIEGPVDAEALERALAALVERHEPLRTGFRMRRGQPVQVIADGRGFRLDRAAIEGDAEARRIAADFARRPFELDRPPLFRALLLTLAAKESLLVLAVHHIAADGWSLGLIVGELLQLYTAFRDGNAVDLPPLAIQYADYAHWQRERLQGEFLERELVWWRTRLAPPLPVLELPADRPRPAIQTFSGDRFDFIVDPALAVSVNTLARRHNASLFMALLAGFNALLHRWSGQADLIVGTPVAGRVRRDLEPLVGLFVNTLALRADLAGDPSFLALLARVREATLGALTHQEVPFERLVQELQPGRDLARNPVFQVMFALQNLPAARAAAAGLRVRPVAIENRTAKFDLSLTMMEAGDRLIGQFEYNADLFERGTIERLSAAFLRLLAAAVAEPGRPVGELPLLDDAERRRVIDDWNDTAVAIEEPAMAHFAISETAARQPDAVAVAQEGLLLTYGELEARANRLAHHLRARGVVAGDLVGVLMERTPALLPALLGIWKAGAAYLPLDPAYPPARIAYMVADSGARILLTNDRGKELPDAFDRVSFIPLDETFSSLAAEPATSPDIPPDPSRPAYVIYTSGSTGQPKGVVIPHRALVNFLSSVRRAPGLDAGDRLLAVTTLSFDISTLELFLPLRIGARIELSDRATAADGDALASLIDHAGITALQATPATWRLLIEAGWQGRPGFKALCGGEPMGRDLARALLDRGCELWNLYGPTETTVWSTVHRVTTADLAAAIPIGRPIDNTRCYVVDGRGRPVPVGVPGELWIGGAGVATGYLGRPELTAERFLPDPFFPGGRVYRTGDLARWREDGTLDCLGRLDHQVKLRGFRIELGEIEAALVTHPAVEQAVVMVREDTPGDPRLVAWFVPPAGATPDLADMRRHLRERLPFYMIPAVWTPLTALPLTPNGKVDRRALPAPERARGGGASAAPQRPMERILAAVWQSVLGVEAVGLHDNFFDLGGDSLRTVQVVARMHEESGIRLNPREFMLQTLGQVAALYERAAAAPSPAGEVIR